MRQMYLGWVLVGLMIVPFFAAKSATIQLDQISQAEFDEISKEFGANVLHRSLMPPEPLGKIIGIEIGAVAGITQSSELEKLVKRANPSGDEVSAIPHAQALLAVSVPMGITGEVTLLPTLELGDLEYAQLSYAAKWTFSEFLSKLPLDVAVKVHGSKNSITYSQVIQNSSTSNVPVNSTIEVDTDTFGVAAEIGKDFVFLEPYAGLGFVNSKTEIRVTGATDPNATLFAFTSAQSSESKHSSLHTYVGLQFDLFLLKIAAQYDNAFGVNSYTAKLSFGF